MRPVGRRGDRLEHRLETCGTRVADQLVEAPELVLGRAAERLEERGRRLAGPEALAEQHDAARADQRS